MRDVTEDDTPDDVVALRERAVALAPTMATDAARVMALGRRRRAVRAGSRALVVAACAAGLVLVVPPLVSQDVSRTSPASTDERWMQLHGVACGGRVPVRPGVSAGDDDVRFRPTGPIDPAGPGERVAVDLVLVLPATEADLGEPTIEEPPLLLVARDHVVVGLATAAEPPTPDAPVRTEDGLRVSGLRQTIALVDCDSDQPLPPGGYGLYAAQEFVQQSERATTRTSVVSGPWPVEVVAPPGRDDG